MKTTYLAFTVVLLLTIVYPASMTCSEETSSTEKEIPLAELFSKKNIDEYREKHKYIHNPEKIENEPRGEMHKSRCIRPEERGESYSNYKSNMLFNKLSSGDKIEQRKAANEIWLRYGEKKDQLTEEEQDFINKSVQRYLEMSATDFSEGFSQLKRLWHLGSSALLTNVMNPNNNISNLSARMLNLMKNESIVDQLIRLRNNEKNNSNIAKIDFALKYMKVNVRCSGRPQITKVESKKIYDEKIAPILNSVTVPTKKNTTDKKEEPVK